MTMHLAIPAAVPLVAKADADAAAACSSGWSGGTGRLRPATSANAALATSSPCSATMRPKRPALTSCAASKPKRVASTRS